MLRVLFLLALLASSTVEAATVTTKTTITNAGWTDLGAGPMLLSFRGQGVYAISDTTPSLVAEGFALAAGDSVALNTTSHVWAMAPNSLGVDAYVAPITPSSGGGGITSITAGATPTSGFTAGQLMMSDGTKVQNTGAPTTVSSWGTVASPMYLQAHPDGPGGWNHFTFANGTADGTGVAIFTQNAAPGYGIITSPSGFYGINSGSNSLSNPGPDIVFAGIPYPGGVAAFRNLNSPTSADAIRVYNTWTDANNGEWGALDWQTTPNVLTIGTQKNGTGQIRTTNIVSGGATISVGSAVLGSYIVLGPATGILPDADNVRSFGNSGYRWSSINAAQYASGASNGVTCSGAPTASFAVTNGIVTHC